MSIIEIDIDLPLDEQGFLRRECPLCNRQYKIFKSEEERENLIREIVNYNLAERNATTDNDSSDNIEYLYCPYCLQKAPKEQWWTQEQLSYIRMYVDNIVVKMINDTMDNIARNVNRLNSPYVRMKKPHKKRLQTEPWIPPEINDMTVVELPCCNTKMKIIEEWRDNIACYICGFVHKIS